MIEIWKISPRDRNDDDINDSGAMGVRVEATLVSTLADHLNKTKTAAIAALHKVDSPACRFESKTVVGLAWENTGKYLAATSEDCHVWLFRIDFEETSEDMSSGQGARGQPLDTTLLPFWLKLPERVNTAAWKPPLASHALTRGVMLANPHVAFLAVGGDGAQLRIWRIETNASTATAVSRVPTPSLESGINCGVKAVAWSPKGNLFSFGCVNPTTNAATEGGVHMWRVTQSLNGNKPDNIELVALKVLPAYGPGLDVKALAMWDIGDSTNGENLTMLAAGGDENGIKLWQIHYFGKGDGGGSEKDLSVSAVLAPALTPYIVSGIDDRMLSVRSLAWNPMAPTAALGSGGLLVAASGQSIINVFHVPDVLGVDSDNAHNTSKDNVVPEVSEVALVARLAGHLFDVQSVSWNSKGTMLASASSDTTVRIWTVLTRDTFCHGKGVPASKFTCDCDDGVDDNVSNNTGSNHTFCSSLSLLEAKSTLNASAVPIAAVSWRPGGSRTRHTLASASLSGEVVIWVAEQGNLDVGVKRLHTFTSELTTAVHTMLAWSPDGSLLAARFRILNKLEPGPINIWAVSDDGSDITAPTVLNVASTQCKETHDLAWRPDGSLLVAACHDRPQALLMFRIFRGDGASVEVVHVKTIMTDSRVSHIVWSEVSDLLLIAGTGHIAVVMDVATDGKSVSSVANLIGPKTGNIDAVAWHSNGVLIAMDAGGGSPTQSVEERMQVNMSIFIWSVESENGGSNVTHMQVATIDKSHGLTQGTVVNQLAWHPSSLLLASVSTSSAIQLWRLAETVTSEKTSSPRARRVYIPSLVATLTGHSSPISSISWNQDGALASGGMDGTIVLWDDVGRKISTGSTGIDTSADSVANGVARSGNIGAAIGSIFAAVFILAGIAFALRRRSMAKQFSGLVGELRAARLKGGAAATSADLAEAAAFLARLNPAGDFFSLSNSLTFLLEIVQNFFLELLPKLCLQCELQRPSLVAKCVQRATSNPI
jgi:WD40 repeat protein